jgi:hypothetical protein
VQQVARSHFRHHRARRVRRADDPRGRLVTVGIERLAQGRVPRHAVTLEDTQELTLDELHPHDHAPGVVAGSSGGKRTVQVVEHRHQIAQERLVRVAGVVLLLPLRAAAHVVHLGQRAEQPVLLLVELPLELRQLVLNRRLRTLGRLNVTHRIKL